ncbi:MAG: metallophosphoesterase [Gemmatimonadetes bacterium]|nr:metallophosphoesterase [Gemmatimonadota bacterium]
MGWASLFVTAVLGLWAFVLEPASLWTPQSRVTLPGFPLDGLRVAVLTDLHVGSPFHGTEKLERIVARTMAEAPDLIVILGDLVIHGVLGGRFVEPEEIAARLGALRAPAGVYAVLGNHDHWLDASRVAAALQANGIPVLEDRAVELPRMGRERAQNETGEGPVWLAGVSDYWEGAHDVARALSLVPAGASVIVITHNPDVFPDVPPRVSLTIAGHTHGGQVRIPLVGTPIVPSDYGSRFASGHIVEDGRHLFVATGTGTSMLPVRFRVPPRVRILELVGGPVR